MFLATDDQYNPLGTMRLLDKRTGKIELDEFIDTKSILPKKIHQSCVEATRFSVPMQERSKDIKISLYISYYLYCISTQAEAGIIWARKGAAKEYRWLQFESIGEQGKFRHDKLSRKEHETYIYRFKNIKKWLEVHPPGKIFQEHHSNIHIPAITPGY